MKCSNIWTFYGVIPFFRQLFFFHIYTFFNEKFGPISGSIGIWPKPIIGLDQQYIVKTVTKVSFWWKWLFFRNCPLTGIRRLHTIRSYQSVPFEYTMSKTYDPSHFASNFTCDFRFILIGLLATTNQDQVAFLEKLVDILYCLKPPTCEPGTFPSSLI